MKIRIKDVNRVFLLATAPFLGAAIWLLLSGMTIMPGDAAYPPLDEDKLPQTGHQADAIVQKLEQANALAVQTAESIKKDAELYSKTNAEMRAIVNSTALQKERPLHIYDRRITIKLGSPSESVQTDNLRAQLYYIKAQHFVGYALKVKLKTDKAMSMVLGKDEFGRSETTLAAVKRYKAFAGVNAGGYADGNGKRYPLSTTVVDGEYVGGFQPSVKDLFFVGLNEDLKLIGGKYSRKDQLDKQKPKFGASFVPILMKNGKKQEIPAKWKTSPLRAPRTVIANYKDDQLLFLVTDGYNEGGRSGATLEEIQILLQRFGVKDAYNLDGGGSSTLVFNGRVVNKPSDGQMRRLATNFLFFK
ncbi:phosphodiester glycosidase family protein [Paenibacillus tarimensis]|uniref:phosphodiester glycosidase family protein n=1 Tax=Paenibacillus tarimensis TaxID=416012 RepID=UPI001F1CB45A|nr:phosphodiester glycosidase family protein [Paenibacillus tarimensis]MCF2945975.1 phosphodiester glycosidase family protein [Paenibacillus tarimensis]